ncbi:MAG TPA: GNAT family N-acetyltransferase [Egibacteraceae bacterium]|nr:GNAT family N-acetyltransferase [Egibacteraceae bacterium]
MFAIRAGHPRDATMLAQLGAETFVDAYAAQVPADGLAEFVANAFSPGVQASELADPKGAFLIAESDGAPIAYAYVREFDEQSGRVLHLARIYARSNWIGRGVGRGLMEACLQEATRRGAGAIRLTVWTQNARAIAFYGRWGFVEVGHESFMLGSEQQTDLVMQRPVARSQPTAAG